MPKQNRPIAVITGASRTIGIGASISRSLAESGWDIALTCWRAYDADMPWGSEPSETDDLVTELQNLGARTALVEADLADPQSPSAVFDSAEQLGPVTALVMSHCHCVVSDIETTTVDSFDKHFAVNARATWLLVREFARRFRCDPGAGRIVAITSDHTAGNLPYGASKGAMDRIVIAAAEEFGAKGITANVVNPGGTDTGWMTDDIKTRIRAETPLGRVGLPQDCANLVRFLCSPEGAWITGQLLYSNGGVK